MKSKKFEAKRLHFTERNLIDLIRKIGIGELTIKAQDGLPMIAEIHDKKRVVLNKEIAGE